MDIVVYARPTEVTYVNVNVARFIPPIALCALIFLFFIFFLYTFFEIIIYFFFFNSCV